jgi:NTP pyrophosphatase (non-canonical NTP hydrolase)
MGYENPYPLNDLAAEILKINRANGWKVATPEAWDDERHIPTLLCLIHSEVSEALEGFRAGDRENVAEELADVLIRVLDLAGGLGIDMDTEVRAKLKKNRQRGHRHGGKAI